MNPLLIRRRGMMTKESVLPDGQLEWIETDGVAYIDAGFVPNVFSSFKAKALLPNDGNFICIAGCREDTHNRFVYLSKLSNGNISFQFGTAIAGGWSVSSETIEYKIRFISTTSKIISITPEGGSEQVINFTNTTNTPSLGSKNLYIFALNNETSDNHVCPSGTRINYMELYSDSNFTTMIRNYLPWRLNGEVGLMDTLTNTFYGNAAGSGAFTGGPNVI